MHDDDERRDGNAWSVEHVRCGSLGVGQRDETHRADRQLVTVVSCTCTTCYMYVTCVIYCLCCCTPPGGAVVLLDRIIL